MPFMQDEILDLLHLDRLTVKNDPGKEPMSQDSLPLTFGVEIECLVALPREAENKYPDITEYIQQDILKPRGLSSNADPTPHQTDYSDWLVTSEGSINTIAWNNEPWLSLNHIFPRMIDEKAADDWSTHPIELVSPPLPAPSVSTTPLTHASIHQIHSYLSAIHPTSPNALTRHSAFTTSECGLHIHIGLPTSLPFPVPLLQNLAYLLIRHEHTLSSLHAPHRQPTPGNQAGQYCRSNHTAFLLDGHTCHTRKSHLISSHAIRRRIFSKDMTVAKLAWMMGSPLPLDENGEYRDKRVAMPVAWNSDRDSFSESQSRSAQWEEGEEGNSSNSAYSTNEADSDSSDAGADPSPTTTRADFRDAYSSGLDAPIGEKHRITRWNLLTRHECEGPATIEFRQHAGTLDVVEVGWWVQLCVALVRCAERLSWGDGGWREVDRVVEDRERERRRKVRGREGQEDVDFEALEGLLELDVLLDLLELGEEAKAYWRRRWDRFDVETGQMEKLRKYEVERGEVTGETCFGCVRESEVGSWDDLRLEVRSEEVNSEGWGSDTSVSTLVGQSEVCPEKINVWNVDVEKTLSEGW